MASAEDDKGLDEKLLEAANNLLHSPPSPHHLLPHLQQVESCLGLVEQSPTASVQAAMATLAVALIGEKLLRHADVDVKVVVASCISEITRISAPDAPLDDDQMKEAYQLIVSSFENLHDISSRSYRKRTGILETVSKVRSCVVMLLECDDLILEMFQHFLKEIREHHPEQVFSAMQNIMTVVLEESEDISLNLLSLILDSIKKENEEVLPIAKELVENVLESCATKLKPYLVQAVNTLGISLDDYSNVLTSICHDGSGSLEQNDVRATSEHVEDKSKSVKEPMEESALVTRKDAKEAAPPQQDNPVGDRSPKSVMSNGDPQVAEDDTLVDLKSPEKQENADCTVQSQGINFSANKDPTNLDTEKVDNSDQNQDQDQATKMRARKTISSSKLAEPSEGSYPANVKEDEKVIDSESHSKEDEKVVASESHSKEDEKVIESESHGKEDEKVIDSDNHSHSKEDDNSDQQQGEARKRRGKKPISSTRLAELSKGSYPANVKEDEKVIDSESRSKEDDNNDQKQGEATKRIGSQPISITKSAEPPKGSYPANVKEVEKVIESESHSKENEKVIDSESHSKKDDNNDQKQGQVTKKRGKRKPISSTKLAELPKGSYPAKVKEDEKVIDSEIHSKEDDDSHQKQGLVSNKRGRKHSSSTNSAANVKEDEKVNDSESHSKEVPSSLHEDDSVEGAGLSKNDKEIDAKISSLKAGNGESDLVASPSPRGRSLHVENRSKKFGRPKKKDSFAKEVAPKDVSKKVYQETSYSGAKPTKRSVKKALGRSSDVKKYIVVNSVKKGNGTASEPDATKLTAKKTEDGKKGGVGSDKKMQGRGKTNSETGAAKSSVKDVDKEMVSLSKSATKSIKGEDLEELPKTNLKRKHTPGKENESGIKKYGENLVGARVKVWWPNDDMFYKGVIKCFIPSKKMHQVTYDDGDIEILNLKNEIWEINAGGADSDGEERADHPSPDAPADMMPKNKNANVGLDRVSHIASNRKRKELERGESSSQAVPAPPPADISSSGFNDDELGSDDQMERANYQDVTLLRSYHEHVAYQIWIGNERGPLTRCTNRAWPIQMLTLARLPQPVQLLVMNSGLSDLIQSAYDRVDRRLITAFCERWYKETCTFHLPCGEMTITLDDVHSILHVPVSGKFIPFTTLEKAKAVDLVVELLGMEWVEAQREITSGFVRFTYLEQWLKRCIREVRYPEATRTFLLYLVGSTLFMNKSLDKVHVHYLEAMRNLDEVNQYAWGASALAYLYQQLAEATRPGTASIAGNMSLLQAWILEHFPDIGCGVLNESYEEHMPRIWRWLAHQSVGGSEDVFRKYIERLRADRVIWTPYDPAHRPHRRFISICYFSGYLRNGRTIHPHLPERVLRQFGHVQGIPRDPPNYLPDPAAVDAIWSIWPEHVVDEATRGPMMRHTGEFAPDYMAWVARYSHPYLVYTTGRHVSVEEGRDGLWRQRMVIVAELAERIQQRRILDMDAISDIVTIARARVEDEIQLLTHRGRQ